MYCSKCGTALAADATFCGHCGTQQVKSASAQGQPTVPASVGVAGMTSYQALGAPAIPGPHGVTYAGFWLRVVAYLIDGVILSAAIFALVIPFIFLTGAVAHLGSLAHQRGEQVDPAVVGALLTVVFVFLGVSILIQWLYHAYLESGEKQATWGKQILGLYVTDISGQPISFGRASGRFFAKIVTGMIPLGIGYAMAGFTERKQALHDMIATCLVLRR